MSDVVRGYSLSCTTIAATAIERSTRQVFFHASDLRDRPFAALDVGTIVDVEIVPGRPGKGPRAAAVYAEGADTNTRGPDAAPKE
jgi:cold shock CspA family protein